MDRSESLAYQYLCEAGFQPIYEPLGMKTCPDFEIMGNTAIEVRRLNENNFHDNYPYGLKTSARAIEKAIESVFAEIKSEKPDGNYWVGLELKRPLIKPKKLKQKLSSSLKSITISSSNVPEPIIINDCVVLRFIQKEEIEKQIYHLGTINDLDRGGWLLEVLSKNINFCIKDKTEKIKNVSKEYIEKWLILIDEISYGDLNEYEINELIKFIKIEPDWNKLIILDSISGNEIIKI